jgi:hypothetical protein
MLRQKRIHLLILIGVFVGILLLFKAPRAYHELTPPVRVMKQFVKAVEQQDAAMVYRLAHPKEKKEFNLTEEGIRLALQETFGQWGTARPTKTTDLAEPRWPGYSIGLKAWGVIWEGSPGRTLQGTASGRIWSYIEMEQTPEGWRVSVTAFLDAVYRSAWGEREGYTKYQALCRRAGIKGVVLLTKQAKKTTQ